MDDRIFPSISVQYTSSLANQNSEKSHVVQKMEDIFIVVINITIIIFLLLTLL